MITKCKMCNVKMMCNIAILVFVVSYLLWGLHVELHLGDENYMALCCKNWDRSPLGLLTFYQGHLWTNVFGDKVYNLRVLAKLSQLIAVGIGCALLYGKSCNLLFTLTIAVLTLLVTYLSNHQLYGWDNGAYPSEALFTVVLLAYISKPSTKRVILLGVACGIMICYRIPLGVGSIISLFVIIACRHSSTNRYKEIAKDVVLGLMSMVAIWFLLSLSAIGSVQGMINCFSPENFISGHGNLVRLLVPDTERILLIVPGIVISTTIGMTAFLFSIVLSKFRKIPLLLYMSCLGFLGLLSISIVYYYFNVELKLIAGLGLPLFVFSILYLPLRTYTNMVNYNVTGLKKPNKITIQIIALMACFLLPVVGSDTWFERFSICYAFPIAVGIIYPLLKESEIRLIYLFALLMIPTLGLMVYCNVSYYQHVGSDEDKEKWGELIGSTYNAKTLNQLEPLIKELQTNKIQYTFFASFPRYQYIYAFEHGVNNSIRYYPLHNFYVQDVVDKDSEKLVNADVIIFPKGSIASFPNIVDFLKGHGYMEFKYTENVDILYTTQKNLGELLKAVE